MIKKFLTFLGIIFLLVIIQAALVSSVLAQAPNKRVEVSLTSQRLYAYEGNTVVYDFPISSGKPWWPTPTGTFKPWTKLRYDRMIGGSKAAGTYYNLPNVPHVVYFYQGYAIHGAYWHNNFGHPMSHGCINVSPANMALLYPWIEYSTPITIYGQAPSS